MTEDGESKLPLEALKRVMPAIVLLLILLVGWFGWNGVRQWRGEAIATDIEQIRDSSAEGVAGTLNTHLKQLQNQLQQTSVQAALAAGDINAVDAAIRGNWQQVEKVQILSANLSQTYARAEQFGYGKLALLESAMQANASVAQVVRDDKSAVLALAAPVNLGRQKSLIYVQLPLSSLTVDIAQADIPSAAYLALGQGRYTIIKKGDESLKSAAEGMTRTVEGSGLRIAAAAPDVAKGPMGLDSMGCFIAAVLFLLATIVVLFLTKGQLAAPKFGKNTRPVKVSGGATLGQLTKHHVPAPVAAIPIPVAEPQPVVKVRLEVSAEIFRAYDIRGVVGKELSREVASQIGQAIGTVMVEKELTAIVVGRDGRLSGPDLSAGLMEGLCLAGINVIDIGMAATPVVYFAGYHLRAGSGVAVTGSHNPPDYNGFKIVIGGETLSGDAITNLYERISKRQLHTANTPGRVQKHNVLEAYIRRIAGDVKMKRPLKVVADAGNGVAGDIAPQLLQAIGAEVIPLFCEVDGQFPNHHPDPSEPHNLQDLIQTVKQFDADIGLAFDGDGDRLGVVTREGEIIFPDRLLMLFAADVLSRNPGAQIIYDVKCTGKLSDYVISHGGSPLMWKTGHSLIKAKMQETGAELAGEMSGHFFFKERWYGFDDGLYSAVRLLEILSQRDETPSEVLNELPNSVSTPEIKVPLTKEEGNPHAVVARFVKVMQVPGALQGDARLTTIDGLRADWSDGWGLLRASNTTPVLVLRFEAENHSALMRIKAVFREQLQSMLPKVDLPF